MNLVRTKVCDNIYLSSIKTDKFKSGIISFSLFHPTNAENSAYGAILSGVLRRGTKKYSDMAKINLRLDELYASSVDIRSTRLGKNLILSFGAELLDNRFSTDGTDILDGVLELISEMMFYPKRQDSLFPEPIVRQEAGFVLDSIKSEINNTRAYAYNRCVEIMKRNDSDFPTLKRVCEIVQNTDTHALSAFYDRMISSSIEVFYIGALDEAEVAKRIIKYFSAHSRGLVYSPILPSPDAPCDFHKAEEAMPVSQGKLAMGMRTGCGINHGDYHAGILLNELFGASPASKLFLNVREKLSLCYHCSSAFDIVSGNITVSSGMDIKNRQVAEEEIIRQFEDIRKGNITDKEIRAAKRSLENVYKQIYDNPFDIQSFYSTRQFFGSSETPEECMSKISTLTTDDIADLAQKTVLDTVFFVKGTLTDNETYEEEEDHENE
jgi:predicted Zn-dependent peptidase